MKKVFIDPGHGGNDPGALGGGLRESDINLSVSNLIANELKRHDIGVYMSRLSDTNVSLEYRASRANDLNADCFVSIHANSSDNKSALGFETWCYSSNKLVTEIHNSFVSDTSLYNKNRFIKESKSLYVLKHTKMKSCLVELGFISNEDDRKLLQNKQKEMAIAIARGIIKYLGVEYIPPKAENKDFYIVAVSACTNKQNADNLVKKLKADGYNDAYIHKC